MAAPALSAAPSDDDVPLNEVHLRGRVSGLPETRALPSGDTVVLVRLVVPRLAPSRPAAREGRQGARRRHPRLRGLARRPPAPGRLVGRR